MAAARRSSPAILCRCRSRHECATHPGGSPEHDNVAMEGALHGAARITVLRPGAIYGWYPRVREAFLGERITRGETMLPLPDGGVQLWHRVAVERVANAIVAALERAPDGVWACKRRRSLRLGLLRSRGPGWPSCSIGDGNRST
jgi:hypothetical protein